MSDLKQGQTMWTDLFIKPLVKYNDKAQTSKGKVMMDGFECIQEFYKDAYYIFLLDALDRVIDCSDNRLKNKYTHWTFNRESVLSSKDIALSDEVEGYKVVFVRYKASSYSTDDCLQKFIKGLKNYLVKNKDYESVLAGLDAIEDGISILDDSGNLLYANKACFDITGLSRQAIGSPIQQFSTGKPVLLNVLEEGKAKIDFEYYLTLKGKVIHLINSAYPIRTEDGSVIGAIDVFRNIKRSRKLADELAGHHAIYSFDNIIGQSRVLNEVKSHAKTFAKSDKSIMIYGESGTGKELFAQSIHNFSDRAASPFVAINCATLPSELIDSELFGYEEGAFTGAKKKGQYGKLELADGGTVFLDEIGDMPIHLQAKLLRVIETKEFTRIGSNKKIGVDIRFLAATNRNLDDLIANGQFRSDLLYRLGVFDLTLPPLRQRQEDILLLVDHFIKKNQDISQKSETILTKGALKLLKTYSWPGNIRELENIISRAVYLSHGKTIDVRLIKNCGLSLEHNNERVSQSMQDVERDHFLSVYEKCNRNKKKTSEALGISRPTVYRLLEKYNVTK